MSENKSSPFLDKILIVNKPREMTSSDVVNRVKRYTGQKKVGHSGTLDRFATGLLVLCTGQATRLTTYFLDSNKAYRAVFQLGESRDTDDHTGEIVERGSFSHITEDDIAGVIKTFIGKQTQVAPQYSALKINGKRSSDRVRSGEKVNVKEREVTIYSYTILHYDRERGQVTVDITCSKGTYIRSLARDLGNQLGCLAHVCTLERTRSGNFSLEEACTLDALEEYQESGKVPDRGIICPSSALGDFSTMILTDGAVERVKNGSWFSNEDVLETSKKEKKMYTLWSKDKNLIAIADIDIEKWHIVYKNVFRTGMC